MIDLKEKIKNGVIMLIITLFLLVATEGFLRLLFSKKLQENASSTWENAYQFNEEYLFDLRPNLDRIFTKSAENGGDSIVWETNQNGFRGKELAKNIGKTIMVVGDSNIQAQFSSFDKTFPYLLKTAFAENSNENIEIINAGVIAFGPDQSFLKLVQQIDIYQPDLVILNIFADNDFGDLVKNQLFKLDKDNKIFRTDFTRTANGVFDMPEDNLWKKRNNSSPFLLIRATQKMNRWLFPVAKEDIGKTLIQSCEEEANKEYEFYQAGKLRAGAQFNDYYDIDLATNPTGESAQLKVKLMRGVLQLFQKFCKEKGVNFLVTIQPSVVDLTDNFYFSYKDLKKYDGYKRTNLTGFVENICEELHLDYLNFYEIFSENNPEMLYFKLNDNHWNDVGQEMAAKATITKVQQIFKRTQLHSE